MQLGVERHLIQLRDGGNLQHFVRHGKIINLDILGAGLGPSLNTGHIGFVKYPGFAAPGSVLYNGEKPFNIRGVRRSSAHLRSACPPSVQRSNRPFKRSSPGRVSPSGGYLKKKRAFLVVYSQQT
jgi:hypothetical protein